MCTLSDNIKSLVIRRRDIALRLAEAEEELEAVDEMFHGLASDMDKQSPETIALARQIYWSHDLPIKMVSSLLGMKQGMKMLKVIGPLRSPWTCADCGKELMYTSRTHRTEIDNEEVHLCADCEKARKAARRKELDERNRQEAGVWQQYISRLKTMPYAEYLQTPHWQEVRKKALRRAGGRCQLCNKNGTVLDVHHRTYERRGQEYAADVIVLCRDCHSKFHGEQS